MNPVPDFTPVRSAVPDVSSPCTTGAPVHYVVPAVSELGTVTAATLGTAGFDRIDDTQYYDD
ncbi:hypothetical protein PUR57_05285 [Streptomyces sp. JV176]|uniref:hypothetical protein n=1 Tax=Streptomyces sp. JV176 TaxID=858630 RepID=UPI002E788801|nr:hypothetical protein [Streptomyces sp. JV176]MEE1798095.1 hypothetical protein [Streptomyces sp. JV176]